MFLSFKTINYIPLLHHNKKLLKAVDRDKNLVTACQRGEKQKNPFNTIIASYLAAEYLRVQASDYKAVFIL